MREGGVALAVVAIAFAACGDDPAPDTRVAPAEPVAVTASPAPPATARASRPPLPGRVDLPALPRYGIALDHGRGVRLLDLSGRVVAMLRGYEIAGNPGSPGVWLQRGPHFFRLRAPAAILDPVPRRRAQDAAYDEVAPRLRPPPRARTPGIGVSGHWRYARRGPDGVLLAQWSDECEVPFAFWKEPGGRPVPITGERDYRRGSPESIALGWAPDGRAIVVLGEGLCGYAGDPPGIYAFDSPGRGSLLYETRGLVRADMW